MADLYFYLILGICFLLLALVLRHFFKSLKSEKNNGNKRFSARFDDSKNIEHLGEITKADLRNNKIITEKTQYQKDKEKIMRKTKLTKL